MSLPNRGDFPHIVMSNDRSGNGSPDAVIRRISVAAHALNLLICHLFSAYLCNLADVLFVLSSPCGNRQWYIRASPLRSLCPLLSIVKQALHK